MRKAAAKAPAKPAKKSSGFSGTFRGTAMGATGTMSLSQKGKSLSGTIRFDQYNYGIRAEVSGKTASGTLSDKTQGGTLPFTAKLSGNTVTLEFQGVEVPFTRTTGSAAKSTASAKPDTSSKGSRNPALVGLWSRTDSMTSGGVSMSTQYFLRVSGNGTFEVGVGRSAGGGAGWSMGGGGGGVEVQARGKWKTQGNIVHINEGSGWQPYARFYIEGRKLMLTFANGNREVWYR